MAENVKTRFCPSPTGLIHLGNARTALFSWLLQRHQHGQFLLRIEDTDKERSKAEYADACESDLQWLGLHWQDGPYYQSQRQAVYDEYYQVLEDKGIAYPCFCSEEELALQRKLQLSQGKPPRYAGTCRHLSQEEVQEKLAQGLKPVLRFHVERHGSSIEYEDFVRGKQKFQAGDIGDFIIRRANGTSPFMYCNAIDDSLMGVTHVVRGEDHITNTPRQLMILMALGLRLPEYGHISLILGSDGSPLSKRTGSRSIQALRESGYFAEAIVNYMARLGHYYGHDKLLSLEQLAEEFKIESLSKSPAKFNLEQMEYWQKEALQHLSFEHLWQWLPETVKVMVPSDQQEAFVELIRPNIHFPQDAVSWAHVVYGELPEFQQESLEVVKQAGTDYFELALQLFEQCGKDYKAITSELKSGLNIKGRALFMPFRVALTGEMHGPELAKLLALLPEDKIRHRFNRAKDSV